MTDIYSFKVNTIDGNEAVLSQYSGKVLLIVNVASECGLTPHYKGLQELYEELNGKGFEVLGFPCNQFGAQEPGNNEEIKTFCELKYKITFPMFAKVDVNGEDAHPLYQYLKSQIAGEDKEDIEWNFAKFLIGKDGKVLQRYHPQVEPREIRADIEAALK